MIHSIKHHHPVSYKKVIQKGEKELLQHKFNNHKFCHVTWCKRLQEDEQKTYKPPKGKSFLSKTKDNLRYKQLKEFMDKFTPQNC